MVARVRAKASQQVFEWARVAWARRERTPTPPAPPPTPRLAAAALAREQIVGRIIQLNPSADADFLDGFSRERLERYLERLEGLEMPRGREARWVREADTPAIVVHSRQF